MSAYRHHAGGGIGSTFLHGATWAAARRLVNALPLGLVLVLVVAGGLVLLAARLSQRRRSRR